jgi:hypothetical protein
MKVTWVGLSAVLSSDPIPARRVASLHLDLLHPPFGPYIANIMLAYAAIRTTLLVPLASSRLQRASLHELHRDYRSRGGLSAIGPQDRQPPTLGTTIAMRSFSGIRYLKELIRGPTDRRVETTASQARPVSLPASFGQPSLWEVMWIAVREVSKLDASYKILVVLSRGKALSDIYEIFREGLPQRRVGKEYGKSKAAGTDDL